VAVGSANVEVEVGIDKLDAGDTGYKIYGGYRFTTNFGLEAAWVDLGKQEDVSVEANLSTEISGWTVEGVGIVPLGQRVELFGKAGLIFANSKIFSDGGVTPFTTDESSANLTAAVGVAFKLKPVAFRVELEFFDIEDTDAVYLASVGVEFRF
jgi:OOP family OmpA-OmpF porin